MNFSNFCSFQLDISYDKEDKKVLAPPSILDLHQKLKNLVPVKL